MTKEERSALLDIVEKVDNLHNVLCLCSLDYKIMEAMQGGEVTADGYTQAAYFDSARERMEQALASFKELREDVTALRDNYNDFMSLHY